MDRTRWTGYGGAMLRGSFLSAPVPHAALDRVAHAPRRRKMFACDPRSSAPTTTPAPAPARSESGLHPLYAVEQHSLACTLHPLTPYASHLLLSHLPVFVSCLSRLRQTGFVPSGIASPPVCRAFVHFFRDRAYVHRIHALARHKAIRTPSADETGHF